MPTVLVTGLIAYCYTELAVSSLPMALTIPQYSLPYPWKNDQAELAWVASLNTKFGIQTRASFNKPGFTGLAAVNPGLTRDQSD